MLAFSYPLLLCCLCLLLCTSCTNQPQPSEARLLHPIGQVIDSPKTTTDVDTVVRAQPKIVTIPPALDSQAQKALLVTQQAKIQALKAQYEKNSDVTGLYWEPIGFSSFLGQEVEYGALELLPLSDSSYRLQADYLNGALLGGKCFWVVNNELILLEVWELAEKTTEDGMKLVEHPLAQIYWHQDSILKIEPNRPNNKTKHEQEHLSDWQLVKAVLEREAAAIEALENQPILLLN